MSQISPKISISYELNPFLIHLVQEVTKRPSAEILNFFHELVGQVCDIGLNKKKSSSRSIRKNITDYFPGTSIPFHILVRGHFSNRWDPTRQIYLDEKQFSCNAQVGFPEERTYVKEEDLKEIAVGLMEKTLLGGEDVTVKDFDKPVINTPKMFKELMDMYSGRPAVKKKSRKSKI